MQLRFISSARIVADSDMSMRIYSSANVAENRLLAVVARQSKATSELFARPRQYFFVAMPT
jgi:hypothetical protein